jgi:excisionase family DNA binding protein
VSYLARALLEELADDPVALERLRELVGNPETGPSQQSAPAFTVRSLAAQLGRTERSVRAAIARGELAAVRRGRGYVISAEAVAAWTQAPPASSSARSPRPRHRRLGPGPATRALRRLQS